MPPFIIDEKKSKLVVMARSKVHDTKLVWTGVTGSIDADLSDLVATTSDITVDMSTGDAGDWVKNRKLRKELDFDKNPSASFALESIGDLQHTGDSVSATLNGKLSWRGKTIDVSVQTQGTLNESSLVVSGKFDIDMTTLGIKAPKVLMIKIDDVVNCEIAIHAAR